MGGKKNQFKDITVNGTATFAYQHQPRFTAPNRIILFDNSQLPNQFCPGMKGDRPCSRGLEIEFDTKDMTMKMVNEWYHPQSIASASRGGVQRLPDGGVLIAWGQNAMYTEYSADGEVVLDFQRSRVFESDHGHVPTIAYRATKGDWVGKPNWGPNISSNASPERDGEKRIYVSWNGATEVTHWALVSVQMLSNCSPFANLISCYPKNRLIWMARRKSQHSANELASKPRSTSLGVTSPLPELLRWIRKAK